MVGFAMIGFAAMFLVAPPAKAKIEFRWLEGKPIEGLTVEKGLQTTCGDERSYPHWKPVLTNKDVTFARVLTHDLRPNGLGIVYEVEFDLTAKAAVKLVDECGNRSLRVLAVFVDGKYWSAWAFRSSEAATFAPRAGFIPSKAEAERIAAGIR